MGKIKLFSELSNITMDNFQRFGSAWISDVTRKFNGQIAFVENIRACGSGNRQSPAEPLSVTFPNGSDVVSVPHNLGFVPNGFILVKADAGETVYAPTGSAYAWTSDTIFLQASNAVNAKIYIV